MVTDTKLEFSGPISIDWSPLTVGGISLFIGAVFAYGSVQSGFLWLGGLAAVFLLASMFLILSFRKPCSEIQRIVIDLEREELRYENLEMLKMIELFPKPTSGTIKFSDILEVSHTTRKSKEQWLTVVLPHRSFYIVDSISDFQLLYATLKTISNGSESCEFVRKPAFKTFVFCLVITIVPAAFVVATLWFL